MKINTTDTVIENLKTRIISKVTNTLNLPVRVSYDENEFNFTVEVFCNTNDFEKIFKTQDKIFDIENEMFPNVEYMLTPIVYSKRETEKCFL